MREIKLASHTAPFFEGIFHNARQNLVIVMDENGIVQGINEAFINFSQYTEDDIVGKLPIMLYTQEDQEKMKFQRELKNVKEQGVSSDNNYLVIKNNSKIWITGEAALVKNDRDEKFIVKIIQSIHEQKTLENVLTDSNNLVEGILKCIKDALVVINKDFIVLKSNKAFCTIFCQEDEVIEGVCLFDINNAFSADQEIKQRIEDSIAGNICITDGEIEITGANGKKRSFKLNTSRIDDDPDKEKRVLMVIHEITMEKEANQQREDMIGFTSHELRNPLANMVLCTELLEDSIEENNIEEARDFLARTKSNINRLNKIISELHDATKAGSGHLQIEKKPFDFEKMVHESIETVKLIHPRFTIVKTGHADIMVNADRYRLAQVITNYLSNAIKYSLQSHVVWVHLKTEPGYVTVEVRDEGTGIAEDQIPLIFTRYYRAEKTMNIEGLGLGLYLSSEIVKAHQGRVWLESKEDQGTTFYFSVPVD